ncbi:hypothetical protein FS749_003505 [Ceratobasidium sp. UAMH 11750]|nr:hypothetical protein FS749_003505 [Ceratobasidium sp. UAMH 11750]
MSQMLAAIVNNQHVASSPAGALDSPAFSPSRTAVVVNMLWFLSLSLSVAVSLVAMLAKEWCYKFTSGRSGPSYEQARRRQRKWNGMERWKMKKALVYLPAMMHLALLLFALGVCLYLWDVDKRVALPVIMVTGSAMLVYTSATIFPALDRFCPYSTPAAETLTDLKFLLMVMAEWILMGTRKLPSWVWEHYSAVPRDNLPSKIVAKISGPKWLSLVLPILPILLWGCWGIVGVLCLPLFALQTVLVLLAKLGESEWLQEPQHYAGVIKAAIESVTKASITTLGLDDKLDDPYSGDVRVPMDIVTSQMLAWLLSNCEDSRSVDTALQAIAGAQSDLPHEPLVECRILEFVLPRMNACIKQNSISPLAIKYCRVYGVLISGPTFGVEGDRWFRGSNLSTVGAQEIYKPLMFYLDQTNLIEQAPEGSTADHNALALAAATILPICHWRVEEYPLRGTRLTKVLKTTTFLIQQQLQAGTNLISEPVLRVLVDSTAHYLIGLWPNEEQSGSYSLLPILLAHLFLFYHRTAPDVARSAAITLAATAFACSAYPGGEQPTPDAEGRETRAVNVLRYFQTHTPDDVTAMALFVFGLHGLLPRLDFSDPETRFVATASYLNEFMQQAPEFSFSRHQYQAIHTLPPRYSLRDQVYTPALQTLTQVATGGSSEDELRVVYTCLPLLSHRTNPIDVPDLYMLALMALCQAKSRQLRDLCISIIDRQLVPFALLWRLDSTLDDRTLLEQLCQTLIDANTPLLPIAVLHFEIMIGSVALRPYPELQERQNALRPLLAFRDRFPELNEPSPLSMGKVSHSKEDLSEEFTRNSMLHAMQCVVDFCEAGLHWDRDWYDKLGRLKDSYKPGTAMIRSLGGAEPGTSSEPTRVEATSSKPGTSSGTGHSVNAHGG